MVFTSDQGDGNGTHRLNQKWTLYEESARVPLVVSHSNSRSGAVDHHLVSNGLDLLPTMYDYADIDPPDGLRRQSLRELAETGSIDD